MVFMHYFKTTQPIIYSLLAICSCMLQAHVPLIGDKAPSFKAQTTLGTVQFPQDFKGKWIIFFSHPADFTPVCQSEFMRAAQMAPEFKAHNAQLVGLSTDSKLTHDVWVKSLEKKMNGEHKIDFPVVADENKDIAHLYAMIHPQANSNQTVRSVYIIDPTGKIRAILHYPITNGRNFYEIKRLLDALQVSDAYQVITPAEWRPGDETIAIEPKTTKN